MNLASLLRWSRRILELLDRGTAGGSVTERTRARFGWMEDYRAVLTEWTRWEDTARPGERLVGSSEVEESVFGKLKTLEGDQCSSGFTRYVLSIGAVVGDWTTTRIKEALEKTPVKMVQAWCKEHLPVSVQAQRRLAFSPYKP